MMLKLRLFIMLLILIVASCKKPTKNLNKLNDLPYIIPAMSGVSAEMLTKNISLTNSGSTDIIFTGMGSTRFTSNHTNLKVEIVNPDIRIYGSVLVDSIYSDTLSVSQAIQMHNRSSGINFSRLDTNLYADGYSSNSQSAITGSLVDERIVTIHLKEKSVLNGGALQMDIEQGALARIQQTYIAFKNVKTDVIFVMDIEKSYELKDIKCL